MLTLFSLPQSPHPLCEAEGRQTKSRISLGSGRVKYPPCNDPMTAKRNDSMTQRQTNLFNSFAHRFELKPDSLLNFAVIKLPGY